jgi:uncharacterized protein YdaU (DUF1376 family)
MRSWSTSWPRRRPRAVADFPALPLFTDAYLGDTMHLGLEEHGAYLKLLMIAWRSPDCALPDDDRRLANMLGVPLKRWCEVLRPVIAPFWLIEGGRWRQKKLTAIRAKVASVSEKRRAAAKASHEAKSLVNGQTGPANAPPLQPILQGLTKTKTKTKEETLAAAPSPATRAPTREEPAPAEPAAAADASQLIILKTGWDEPEAAAAWATLLRFAGGDEDLAYYGLHRALRKGRDLLAYAGKVILAELAERQRPVPSPEPYIDVVAEARRMVAEGGTRH